MDTDKLESIKDLMSVVGSADVGLVILDSKYTVRVWNFFLVNHSGKSADSVMGKSLFDLFPELSNSWFCDKVEQIIATKTKILSTWEQHPYLFQFKNTTTKARKSEYMYQNLTFVPLASSNGAIENFAIVINNLTEIAEGKLNLAEIVDSYSQGQ